MSLDQLLIAFALYCLIPLWIVVGFVDWLCHRAAHISENAGVKESALHLLMLAEIGIPLLAGLFLEINALVLLIMAIGVVAHEATALWDLHYAHAKRDISPIEQHVHSFQEVIPIVLFVVACFLYWEQFTALLVVDERANFSSEWKHAPLPAAYLGAVLGLTTLFVGVPFIEEFIRTSRKAPTRRLFKGN